MCSIHRQVHFGMLQLAADLLALALQAPEVAGREARAAMGRATRAAMDRKLPQVINVACIQLAPRQVLVARLCSIHGQVHFGMLQLAADLLALALQAPEVVGRVTTREARVAMGRATRAATGRTPPQVINVACIQACSPTGFSGKAVLKT